MPFTCRTLDVRRPHSPHGQIFKDPRTLLFNGVICRAVLPRRVGEENWGDRRRVRQMSRGARTLPRAYQEAWFDFFNVPALL